MSAKNGVNRSPKMAAKTDQPLGQDLPDSFFFDNIRSDNNDLRLAALRSVKALARKLGPDETIKSIFPLLHELAKEVDEDIRFALLNELSDFSDYIGGESSVPTLLTTLEIFLSSDDTTIRNRGIEVVLRISEKLSNDKMANIFVPFVLKLMSNEWFTARMSGIILWPTAYKCNNKEKQTVLLSEIIELANDKIMSVRRVFVMAVPEIYSVIPAEDFFDKIFPLAVEFFSDPLDSIKMSAIDSFVILLPNLKDRKEDYKNIFKQLRDLIEDKSWRVRYTLVIKYPELRDLAESGQDRHHLLSDINNLLDDREPEVRMAAASILSKMFHGESPEYLDQFFSAPMWERIDNLINSGDSDMGSTVVEQVGEISKLISDIQYRENFIPFLERVLKNSNPEVKLKGLSIMSSVRKEFNVLENNLVDGLKDMSSSSSWRVRLSLVEHVGTIAPSMEFESTESSWTAWCNEMLKDEANAVRESTVITVLELMKKLGEQWIRKFVEERFKFYQECDSYLLRITTIYLLQQICAECTSTQLKNIVIDNLITFATDRVANVRLNVARTLGALKNSVDALHLSTVISTLKKISTEDTDPDVVYFSTKALRCYEAH